MAETSSLPLGVTDPVASTFAVASDPARFDLSAVTSVSWEVTRPDGAVVIWPAVVVTKTPAELVTSHAHAAGDVSIPGHYSVRVLMVAGGKTVPSYRATLTGDPRL